jgi:hypothetical protein
LLDRRFLLYLVVALSFSTLASANSTTINMTFLYPGTNVALDSNARLLTKSAPSGEFKGLVLYTPASGSPGQGPREFIGYRGTPVATPEPTSLMLLSTGLIGLAGMMRRKLRA